MDEPTQKPDLTSLKESPRRQKDGQHDQVYRPEPSDGTLEPSLISANPRQAKRREGAGFKDIPVGQKLALVGLAFALPITLLLFFILQRDNASVAFSQKGLVGARYLAATLPLLQSTNEYRNLINYTPADVDARRAEAVASVEKTVAALQTLVEQDGNALELQTDIQTLSDAWKTLRTSEERLYSMEQVNAYTDFIRHHVLGLISKISANSNLIFDADLDSYYTMKLATDALPQKLEVQGRVFSNSLGIIRWQTYSLQNRLILQKLIGVNNQSNTAIEDSVSQIGLEDPVLRSTFAGLYEEAKNAASQSALQAEYLTLKSDAALINPDTFYQDFSKSSKAHTDLYNYSLQTLQDLFQQRITRLRQNTLYTLLGVAAGLLLAIGLIVYITRQITRPLSELGSVSELVGRGDLSQLAQIESRDEIGRLAKSFNTSILQLRDANARQEAEIARGHRLQQNIGEFLNVAMDIAQGDFTKRGQVSEDALGNVVDAINYMTEELAYVLRDVQSATDSVSQGATDVFSTTDEIAQRAQQQASEAQRARDEVQVITSSIRQMATTAGSSAQAAERTLLASQEGRQAVTETLSEMQNIRREVQAVAKRVKGLSDRSLEISEIVETISKIAKQTNLLALNAALEASAAGDAGARFATVAGEVRSLAENTTASVQRVAGLIKSVQDEVQEVLTGVEAGNRQVEDGYRVAQQAGQRLEEIATIAEQTAQFAQEISNVTREQVNRTLQVGQVVEQMAEISEESQTTVSQGREAAERLQALASQLSSSIARFRVV
jgi:twitching motility protein PilJ